MEILGGIFANIMPRHSKFGFQVDFRLESLRVLPLHSGLFFLLLMLLVVVQSSSRGAVHEESVPRPRHDLIVKFKSSAAPALKNRALKNATAVQSLESALTRQGVAGSRSSLELLTVKPGVDLSSEIARLELEPAVEFVERNYPIHLFDTSTPVIPDDFSFSKMYALQNSGTGGGKTNADMDAPEAWRFGTGDKKIVVAVIDTGIDYFHEDLQENLWINTKEIPFNGIDDDGNGYVDDYHGYDFVSRDSDPYDDNEHGTHVAGIIGAKGNNGIGTVGLCWNVSLMAVKAFDEKGNGSVADAIAAIHYAAANGARVINASWGLDERSRALEEAVESAANAGVLFVAAAGNNRSDVPAYPASFETVLSVGATDNKDARADFSNYGSYVDVAAPGANIFSTLPENSYGYLSGTSMAAPQVSGIAALVLSRFPKYSRQELFDILINSVDPVLFDQPLGNGRVNAARAVQMDEPLPTARINVPSNVSAQIDVSGTAQGTFYSGYGLFIGAGKTPTNWIQISSSSAVVTNGFLGRIDTSVVPDGAAVVQLVASNRNGASAIVSAPIKVLNALITAPLSADVLSPGKYEIRGTVYGEGKTYQLFYGAGLVPKEWQAISETAPGGVVEGRLGEWDASNIRDGVYCLKLVATDRNNRSEFLAPGIYIDHHLKSGWPIHLPIDSDFPLAEWRNMRAADLDGDGKQELVLIDPSTRTHEQSLMVFSAAGEMLWSRNLGFDLPPDVPAIGDMDGDGKLEIFADTTNGVAGFRYDGTPLGAGWPALSATRNHAKVLADLDGDGRLELITFSQEYSATQVPDMRELAVFNDAGALVRAWQLPWCGFTNDVQKIFPALANLDDEPGLEIVAVSGCSEIAAFDYRSAEPKWRGSVEGTVLASPVIGDIDGNGSPDVVVVAAAESGASTGGVTIFNGNGQRWPGWPVLEEYSFTTPPALADLDKDGRLEIVVPSTTPTALHVLQWDGFEADGWPQDVFEKATSRIGATIADVNFDGYSDIVLPASGYLAFAISLNDSTAVGGITAWDFSGKVLPFNGTNVIPALGIGSFSAFRWHKFTPAILTDLDGNGFLDIAATSVQEAAMGTLKMSKNRSGIYTWELSDSKIKTPIEWPMFAHDAANSGAYSLPLAPIIVPTNITRAIRDRVIAGEDHELRIEPLKNDWAAGGARLTLIDFTQPANGTVRRDGTATLVYLSATNFSGMDGFTYRIRDEHGFESSAQVVLRVRPSDDPPSAKNIELTMKKNTSVSVFYEASDPEGKPLSFHIVDPPLHGELWNYPNVGSYMPTRGFFGTDFFSYVANDGKHDSQLATVSITVVNSNNPPVAISQDLLTKTNRSVLILPIGEDADDDPLTFELVTGPQRGDVVAEGSGFRFTPEKDFIGAVSFTLRPFDGTAFGTEVPVNIAVIATNAAPRAGDLSLTVQPNTETSLKLSGSDPDGDSIQFTIINPPLHGTLTGAPPELEYLPATDYVGPDRFTFGVADGFDESSPATVTIHVSRQNRPPESRDQTVLTSEGVPLEVALDSSDPDGDAVQSVILKGPANGLLYGNGTNLVYAPFAGSAGTDSFTYKLWDGQKFGNVARVIVRVSPPREEQAPSFLSVRQVDGVIELILNTPNQFPFHILSSTNFVNWSEISGPITSSEETFRFQDTNTVAAERFYRAVR